MKKSMRSKTSAFYRMIFPTMAFFLNAQILSFHSSEGLRRSPLETAEAGPMLCQMIQPMMMFAPMLMQMKAQTEEKKMEGVTSYFGSSQFQSDLKKVNSPTTSREEKQAIMSRLRDMAAKAGITSQVEALVNLSRKSPAQANEQAKSLAASLQNKNGEDLQKNIMGTMMMIMIASMIACMIPDPPGPQAAAPPQGQQGPPPQQ